MYSYHSILECYNQFSGVKLSIRSFPFICCIALLNIVILIHGMMI